MKLSVWVLSTVVLAVLADEECGVSVIKRIEDQNIVHGREAVPKQWPWQVLVRQVDNPNNDCGGTLISNEWVLTAASCLRTFNPQNYRVAAGFVNKNDHKNQTIVDVAQLVTHPNYHKEGLEEIDNLALIKLSSPLPYSEYIRPVCLPTMDRGIARPPNVATVTGWGITQPTSNGTGSNLLMQSLAPFVGKTECHEDLDMDIGETVLCAGNKQGAPCNMDEGGPLVMRDDQRRWFQYGITSNVINCGVDNKAEIFTRVSEYCQFIKVITGVICVHPEYRNTFVNWLFSA